MPDSPVSPAPRLLALPTRTDAQEWLRPWKLLSFAAGMGWLLYGALNYRIADWDVGISLLMGTLTYLFAPLGLRALFRAFRTPSRLALTDAVVALAIAWFTIDGVYVAYHSAVGNTMYRIENAWASTPLYFLAGFAWLYQGSLRQLLGELRAATR
jgi:hypothetical protein